MSIHCIHFQSEYTEVDVNKSGTPWVEDLGEKRSGFGTDGPLAPPLSPSTMSHSRGPFLCTVKAT